MEKTSMTSWERQLILQKIFSLLYLTSKLLPAICAMPQLTVQLVLMAVFKYACLRSNIAPLDSESSSLVPTSANTPIWTLDGTEMDSVSTVRPDGNLVDLYVGGTGVKTLWGILGWVWMDDDAKLQPLWLGSFKYKESYRYLVIPKLYLFFTINLIFIYIPINYLFHLKYSNILFIHPLATFSSLCSSPSLSLPPHLLNQLLFISSQPLVIPTLPNPSFSPAYLTQGSTQAPFYHQIIGQTSAFTHHSPRIATQILQNPKQMLPHLPSICGQRITYQQLKRCFWWKLLKRFSRQRLFGEREIKGILVSLSYPRRKAYLILVFNLLAIIFQFNRTYYRIFQCDFQYSQINIRTISFYFFSIHLFLFNVLSICIQFPIFYLFLNLLHTTGHFSYGSILKLEYLSKIETPSSSFLIKIFLLMIQESENRFFV